MLIQVVSWALVGFGGGGADGLLSTEMDRADVLPGWLGGDLDLVLRVQGRLLLQVGGNYCCTVRLTKTVVPRATLYGTDAASLLPLSVRCEMQGKQGE